MALTVTALERQFTYNGVALPDFTGMTKALCPWSRSCCASRSAVASFA